MKITDKKMAKWVNSGWATLQLWKKPDSKKHNLYKSLQNGFYLLKCKNEEDEKCCNNVKELKDNLSNLEALLHLACKESNYKEDINKHFKVVKDIIENLRE